MCLALAAMCVEPQWLCVSGHSGHVCMASVAMFARPRWPMYVFGLGGHDECWPRWPLICT